MRSFSLLPLLCLLAGCGGEPYPTAPVSGQIKLNGLPLTNAAITFQPVADSDNMSAGPGSGAFTDENGRYTLKIIGKEMRGAVIGKHKVRIHLVHQSDPDDDRAQWYHDLPAKYNRSTILEYDVLANGTDTADFVLTVP
jgi:hypothetical protein